MSLFGSAQVGADNRRLLLTIRAGRMYRANSDNLIHPDPRSGILSLTMEASGVIDVKWEALAGSTSSSNKNDKDMNGNAYPANESLVVMPGGAKFERVTKCTTGRVFLIDLDSRQMFYWLQEQPDKERDESYFKAIKHAIEGKTRAGAVAGSTATAGGRGSTSSPTGAAANANNSSIQLSALQNILTNLGGQQQQGSSGSTNTPATNAAGANPSNNAAALSNLMSQMQSNNSTTTRPSNVSVNGVVLSAPAKEALRADPAFYMSRLFEHLPQGTDPTDEVYTQVQNAQFQDSTRVLDAALQDPNGYREVMNAFGLQPPQGVPPSSYGLLQAILNEKPQEKNKAGDDAAPASQEGGNNNNNNNSNNNTNNDDAAPSS